MLRGLRSMITGDVLVVGLARGSEMRHKSVSIQLDAWRNSAAEDGLVSGELFSGLVNLCAADSNSPRRGSTQRRGV